MFNQYGPMMGYGIGRSFNFSSLLNNAQKTLNIVNQALPIVKEVSPIVKNARTIFNLAKGFNSVTSPNTNNITNNYKESNNYVNMQSTSYNNNNPSFFI